MKHFINLKDISTKDLRKIIVDAKKRKKLRKKLNTLEVDKGSPLKGKILIQMFEKPSSRTRISFYLAIKQLGGGTLTLRSNELHLGQGGESITDTAKVLSTYGDGFMLRTDSDNKVDNFKKVVKEDNSKKEIKPIIKFWLTNKFCVLIKNILLLFRFIMSVLKISFFIVIKFYSKMFIIF